MPGPQSRILVENVEAEVDPVLAIIGNKLHSRLEEKGKHTFISPHEILGIVTEEYKELIDAVQADKLAILEHELIDVAVACVWGLVSLYQHYPLEDGR